MSLEFVIIFAIITTSTNTLCHQLPLDFVNHVFQCLYLLIPVLIVVNLMWHITFQVRMKKYVSQLNISVVNR